MATLDRYAPAMPVHGIAADLHAVISLPEGVSEADVLTAARERKIALTGLASFWHDPSHRAQGIVIDYGTPAEHEYPTALQRLRQLMRTVA
jgi:GntR family transcriptional regulator/MocR family aminotransferase